MSTVTIPRVTTTELAMLILAVEDRIAEQEERLRHGIESGLEQETINARELYLAASRSALVKLRAANP